MPASRASTAGRSSVSRKTTTASFRPGRSSVSTRAGFAPAVRLDVSRLLAAAQKKAAVGKPKPKKAAQPRSRATTTPSFTKALSVFSPSSPHLVPTLTASGEAFPVTGMYRRTIDHTVGYRRVVFFSNNGKAANVMLSGSMTVAGDALPGWSTFAAPTVALDDTHGGPTAGRAMKMGFSIVNSTAAMTAGGRVFVLNCEQRLLMENAPTNLTRAAYNSLLNAVVNHPSCKEYSGGDFKKAHSWYSHVVDNVHYEKFATWEGTQDANDYASYFATWDGAEPNHDRSMSTLCLVFEDAVAPQSYTITGRASWYTRWPLTTVLGQSHTDIPTAPADAMNRHFRHAAAAAHDPLYYGPETMG